MATYTYTIGVGTTARELKEERLHAEILVALPTRGFAGILRDAGTLTVDIDTLSDGDKTTLDGILKNHNPDLSVPESQCLSAALLNINGGIIYSTTGSPLTKVNP